MTESLDRRRASYRVLVATLWLTLIIFMIKLWAGFTTRSLCVLAESLHTLIDGFSTLLSMMATRLPYSDMKRSPWVHGKWETICALALTAILGFTGCSLLLMSSQQLITGFRPEGVVFEPDINPSMIQLLWVVVAIHFCMVLFERYEGRMLNSQALKVNAHHVLHDGWLTLVMLAGLIAIWRGWIWLDAVLTLFLLLTGVHSLWQVLNRQLPLLVQQMAIAPEVLHRLACQVDGVVHCYGIRAQGVVGRQVYVEMNLVLRPDVVSAAQAIADHLETLIQDRYGPVCTVIHVDNLHPTPRRRFLPVPPGRYGPPRKR